MNIPTIDPQVLQTFVAIAETGSFAGAARRVGRTEAAVSLQMKRLEEMAGQPSLFVKIGRRMLMSDRAHMLFGHAVKILQAYNDLNTEISFEQQKGALRLGVPEDYLESLLPQALKRFSKLYPRIRVELTCHPSEVLVRLMDEKVLDLAVVTQRDNAPETMESLRVEPMVWTAAQAFQPEQQVVIPIATYQAGCWGREAALRACAQSGISHHVAYSSPSLSGILWAVRQGLAVAPLAQCSVPSDLKILDSRAKLPTLPPLTIALMKNTPHRMAGTIQSAMEAEIRQEMRAPRRRLQGETTAA